MGPKITTAKDFAIELRDYISENALRGKELKSLSKSIGYPLGIFRFNNRAILTSELVFLNVFLGTVALKVCFSENPDIPDDVLNEIIEVFKRNLINQWLPESMYSDYQERLNIWDKFFEDVQNEDKYQEGISKLAKTFYEFLTKSPCNQQNELMLTMRFNGYMKLLIESINVMIEDLSL
ncbi:unnamed protein product [marine sediment metagenome]|uniref:Uncharacterized protein n=1 Tax=marine sediment metagenome TaxID=412755 RepID=X0RZ00_9ZZZZ